MAVSQLLPNEHSAGHNYIKGTRNTQCFFGVLQRFSSIMCLFLKVKLFSFFSLTDELDNITDEECSEKLEKMKENMIKSYNYSQGMQNHNTDVSLTLC